MKTIRILSIDGGGIRGVMPAVLLAALERQSGSPIHEMFDLVTGTSTGAILAGALFKRNPLTAQQVLDLYIREGRAIFAPEPLRYITSAVAGPKYDEKPLERILQSVFGDAWLSECLKPVLIPSYELTRRQAWFFKSWKAQAQDLLPSEFPGLYDYRMCHVVRASSAAPTYFRPAKFRSRAGEEGVFIDGAAVANNPALCALASARRLNPDMSHAILVSLGTGQQAQPISYSESSSWGLLNWARPALDCMIDGAADAVAYQVDEAFGREIEQYRFDFANEGFLAGGAIDDANVNNIRRLVLAGEEEVRRSQAAIAALPGLLMNARSIA